MKVDISNIKIHTCSRVVSTALNKVNPHDSWNVVSSLPALLTLMETTSVTSSACVLNKLKASMWADGYNARAGSVEAHVLAASFKSKRAYVVDAMSSSVVFVVTDIEAFLTTVRDIAKVAGVHGA